MVKQTASDSIHYFSDKADYSVFNKAWKKITGPAAENLGSVFFGSSVVIQFGTMGEGRGDKENQANREEVADSRNIVNKHSINVGFYNPAQSSLQGKGEEGVRPQTGKKVFALVKGMCNNLKSKYFLLCGAQETKIHNLINVFSFFSFLSDGIKDHCQRLRWRTEVHQR